VVLWVAWDKDVALQEIVAVVVAAAIGGLLVPGVRYALAYINAPRRILEIRVERLEAEAKRAAAANAETSAAQESSATKERDREVLVAAHAVLEELNHADASIRRWLQAGFWQRGEAFGADAWIRNRAALAGEPLFSGVISSITDARSDLDGLNHEAYDRAGADAWHLDDEDRERLAGIAQTVRIASSRIERQIKVLEQRVS
jgi:hypothetical protein